MSERFFWIMGILSALLVAGFAVFGGIWCNNHHERFYILEGDKVYVCDDVHGCMFHNDGIELIKVADVVFIDGDYYYFSGKLSVRIPSDKIRKGA